MVEQMSSRLWHLCIGPARPGALLSVTLRELVSIATFAFSSNLYLNPMKERLYPIYFFNERMKLVTNRKSHVTYRNKLPSM